MSHFDPDSPAPNPETTSPAAPDPVGATGIFGTVTPAPEAAVAPSAEPAPMPGGPSVTPTPEPELPRRDPRPVVHEVIFYAPGSGDLGLTDPLRRLLRSTPAPMPAPAPAPAPPQTFVPINAGFTQLLTALTAEELAAAASPRNAAPVAPVEALHPASQAARRVSLDAHGGAAAPAQAGTAAEAQGANDSTQPDGATQIFSLPFSPEAAKAAVTEAGSLPRVGDSYLPEAAEPSSPPLPAAFSENASFTQLFTNLDASVFAPAEDAPTKPSAESTLPEPKAEVKPANAPHGPMLTDSTAAFTQVFQGVPPAALSTLNPGAQPGVAARVTSPVAREPAVSTPEAGSFTQLFGVMPEAPPVVAEPAPSGTQALAPPPAEAPAMPAATDGLTQVFRPGMATSPSPAGPVSPVAPQSLPTQLGPTPSATPPVVATPYAATPGAFTQIFAALSAEMSKPLPTSPEAAAAETRPAFPSVQTPPAPQPPGAFTQIFGTLGSEAPASPTPAPAPRSTEGSFTQLFSTMGLAPRPEPTQADHFPPMPGAAGQPNAFPPPAATQNPPLMPASRPQGDPLHNPFANQGYIPPAAQASPGGLTQLLRTLDAPAPASAAPYGSQGAATGTNAFPPAFHGRGHATDSDPLAAFPAQGAAPSPGSGATVAFRPPEGLQRPAVAPPMSSGPGEFTRILQASALRESNLAGMGTPQPSSHPGGSAPQAAPPQAAAPAHGGTSLPPWSMPPVPHMPHMNSAGAMMTPAPVPHMPHAPAFHMPPALPHAPTAAPAPAAKPSMLPIVLIAIIVVLVAALLAVLLLKH